jgi:hypothetical protein
VVKGCTEIEYQHITKGGGAYNPDWAFQKVSDPDPTLYYLFAHIFEYDNSNYSNVCRKCTSKSTI